MRYIIMFLISLLIVYTCSNEPPIKPISNEPKSKDAYWLCQEGVKKLLVSPSSAVFPYIGNISISSKDLNIYEKEFMIAGYYDAQNKFGATLQGHYICRVVGKTGNQWRPATVIIK